MAYEILIKLPKEFAGDARAFWKELRVADALPPESDLPDPDTVDRFDGAALAEWVVPISETLKPLIAAFLGYLVARKGEVEIRNGKEVHKFRNMTPRQIGKVMEIVNAKKRSVKKAASKKKPNAKPKRT